MKIAPIDSRISGGATVSTWRVVLFMSTCTRDIPGESLSPEIAKAPGRPPETMRVLPYKRTS